MGALFAVGITGVVLVVSLMLCVAHKDWRMQYMENQKLENERKFYFGGFS